MSISQFSLILLQLCHAAMSITFDQSMLEKDRLYIVSAASSAVTGDLVGQPQMDSEMQEAQSCRDWAS
eukprot:1070789-Amphidinium_carterae.1